ncbi:uncharacterized protein LOC117645249 [Thrips palmi]|uniref:Uncharacterized protein LOC117645249 n=1 Tax=Thrips palmi TaxID=161013 RepID=A0A6P8Z3M6_THRPL|nr:uncharacterized protein LOC117645249 [Thrips palmi]
MPLTSISDVVGATNEGIRCLIEGERVLEGKMLITVGSLGVSDNRVLKVWALCLQSSTLSGAPHVIEASLNLRSTSKRVVKIKCSCKAGQSEKCKHCIALLMYLNRLDDESHLEDLSCTDLTQQWGKLKKTSLSEFEAVPLTKFCHFIPPQPIYAKGIPDVSDELALEFAQLIIQGAPKSESYLHSTRARAVLSAVTCSSDTLSSEADNRRQSAGKLTEALLDNTKFSCLKKLKALTDARVNALSPDLLEFYNKNVVVSTQQSVMLASFTATQCEEMWDVARKVRVTGTRVYPLSTYTKNKKADWGKKLEKVFNSQFKGTPATMYGLENEPKARATYAKKCGVKVVENGILVHPDVPWLGTSVDGVVVDDEEKPQKVIEIKCLVAGKTVTASELPKLADCCQKRKLKKKHKFHGQVQLAMLLAGLDKCDFILYSSMDDTFVSQCVLYDDKFMYDTVKPVLDIYFSEILPYLYTKMSVESGNEEEDEEELE